MNGQLQQLSRPLILSDRTASGDFVGVVDCLGRWTTMDRLFTVERGCWKWDVTPWAKSPDFCILICPCLLARALCLLMGGIRVMIIALQDHQWQFLPACAQYVTICAGGLAVQGPFAALLANTNREKGTFYQVTRKCVSDLESSGKCTHVEMTL